MKSEELDLPHLCQASPSVPRGVSNLSPPQPILVEPGLLCRLLRGYLGATQCIATGIIGRLVRKIKRWLCKSAT